MNRNAAASDLDSRQPGRTTKGWTPSAPARKKQSAKRQEEQPDESPHRPGGGYAAAVQSLAGIMEDPPRRGATVEWAGQTYRLNQRAVDDLLIAYNRRAADCGHIVHLYLATQGQALLLRLEHTPYPRDPGRRDLPCPEGHEKQAEALRTKRRPPRQCPHCGKTPTLLPVAQNADPQAAGYFADPEELPEAWRDAVRELQEEIKQ